jgi:chromosome segregation protein
VGNASVELVFDNSDGKIGGAYASYAEISLKRLVSRDGTSSYYINGGKCRRKDITQLFLGTGLGSRSYAIIEQGMISRVIEAKADDMRAFLEEAAGISLYKERRRETEARIGDARENLARLQDLRDEIDKQIRHLQRQASAARRYQEHRGRERQLTAELLALRLRELDSGAAVHDEATRERELAMQQELAGQRAIEAALEKQREFHGQLGEALQRVQGRYYELGGEITRTEEQVHYTTELRNRHRNDHAQTEQALRELGAQLVGDQERMAQLAAEIAALAPELEGLRGNEQRSTEALGSAESAQSAWQQRWEAYNHELGAARQSAEVEGARIEQLEAQLLRLQAQSDRLELELEAVGQQQDDSPVAALAEREGTAAGQARQAEAQLVQARDAVQRLRGERQSAEARLEQLRGARDRARAGFLSLEALQQAALGEKDPAAASWLDDFSRRPGGKAATRLASLIDVDPGFEHAVETVLGDYLEAVCLPSLDELGGELARLQRGSLSFLEAGSAGQPAPGASLAARVRGPAAALAVLGRVRVSGSLAEALAARASLAAGESLVTREGEWLGRDWLRCRRGGDAHAGVLERAHRLKELAAERDRSESELHAAGESLDGLRNALLAAESARDGAQLAIQAAHREHGELRAQLGAHRARLEEANQRRTRLERERAEVAAELARAREALASARAGQAQAHESLQALDERLPALTEERELFREQTGTARTAAAAAQLALRDALIRHESRRSTRDSMLANESRLVEQRNQLTQRFDGLVAELASGDGPIQELQARLQEALARRHELEAELNTSRQSLEDADRELHSLEQRRQAAEQRVNVAREAMDTARLAAQETRVRREGLIEQFAQTQMALDEVNAGLAAEASTAAWEEQLAAVRADIEKLGAVNLAAIDELAQQTERKTYLDRQYADVNDALTTLEEAMKRMDSETRARFEDTFNRVNAGLQEKFPRLFGGGHAYLELVGPDPLAAGVAIMARPPGKRNSSISQLSGGEKALTAVALVFAIFDLNPAPFCLLDEVDAPLDEHNVGRFCEIVREMASRVQFIFITHNKTTMELASQLMGVTMNEPGVSRLVSVDVDEAVRLAAV